MVPLLGLLISVCYLTLIYKVWSDKNAQGKSFQINTDISHKVYFHFIECRGKRKVKEESEKTGLELNIQKTKIMALGPITSRQIGGQTMETVTDFIFLGSKITADGDCSHEIKRCLFLGRKAMTNPDSTVQSRDITLLTKFCLVKAMVFPVVMYGCESWTIKTAEC